MADGINQMDEIDLNNLDFSESGDESSSSSESDNDPIPLRIHISNLWTRPTTRKLGKMVIVSMIFLWSVMHATQIDKHE